MEPFKLEIAYEESPASNTAIALYISVYIQDAAMEDILDVEAFFQALAKPGIHPLFTCSCGNFGCGGYYVEVIHEPLGLSLKNSYDPLQAPNETSLRDRFEYRLSWRDALNMGKEILATLREIGIKWPEYAIFSGTYCCLNLAERVPVYQEVLARLEAKFKE